LPGTTGDTEEGRVLRAWSKQSADLEESRVFKGKADKGPKVLGV
jgi:hypothetical protein